MSRGPALAKENWDVADVGRKMAGQQADWAKRLNFTRKREGQRKQRSGEGLPSSVRPPDGSQSSVLSLVYVA